MDNRYDSIARLRLPFAPHATVHATKHILRLSGGRNVLSTFTYYSPGGRRVRHTQLRHHRRAGRLQHARAAAQRGPRRGGGRHTYSRLTCLVGSLLTRFLLSYSVLSYSVIQNLVIQYSVVFIQLLTYSLTHLLTYSLTHLLIYSLTHLLIYSLTHLLTYSLTHLGRPGRRIRAGEAGCFRRRSSSSSSSRRWNLGASNPSRLRGSRREARPLHLAGGGRDQGAGRARAYGRRRSGPMRSESGSSRFSRQSSALAMQGFTFSAMSQPGW